MNDPRVPNPEKPDPRSDPRERPIDSPTGKRPPFAEGDAGQSIDGKPQPGDTSKEPLPTI